MPRLRVLFVVSECVPIVKTGGLGDVAGALPAALRARGHDVRILMPRYRAAKGFPARRLEGPLGVPMGGGTRWCAVYEGELAGGVPIYLLEHDVLYDRDGTYGDRHGDFGDNALRFGLLSHAAHVLHETTGFQPDLFHANDWQTGLVPIYGGLRGDRRPSVLSIHNLGYQGWFSPDDLRGLGFGGEQALRYGLETYGNLNYLKGGILNATMISTVSPRYAQEIATPDGGMGLDWALRQRRDALVGILNGIDDNVWNPAADEHLPASYDADDLAGKALCKAALQRELGMPERPDVPVVGMVTRFAHQKGIDVFAGALGRLLSHDVQFAILGSGEGWAEELFTGLSQQVPNVGAYIGISERLAHLVEAGADMFVMASRYEPCGLNQMYSQRYGTLPVVRAVGGLFDTVDHGLTGFSFDELSADALAHTLLGAMAIYRDDPERWRRMQRISMNKRMGWDASAAQYEALYRLASIRARR